MAKQAPDTDKGRDTVRDQTRFQTQSCISLVVIYVHMQTPPPPLATFSEYYLATLLVSWHFIQFYPTRQIFLPRRTAHVQNNIVSYSKQQYLMYLYYCKGRFRVGVGVNFNKTQSNRYKKICIVGFRY